MAQPVPNPVPPVPGAAPPAPKPIAPKVNEDTFISMDELSHELIGSARPPKSNRPRRRLRRRCRK